MVVRWISVGTSGILHACHQQRHMLGVDHVPLCGEVGMREIEIDPEGRRWCLACRRRLSRGVTPD